MASEQICRSSGKSLRFIGQESVKEILVTQIKSWRQRLEIKSRGIKNCLLEDVITPMVKERAAVQLGTLYRSFPTAQFMFPCWPISRRQSIQGVG